MKRKPWLQAQRPKEGKALLVGDIIDDYLLSAHFRGLARSTGSHYRRILENFQGIAVQGHASIYYMKAYKVNYGIVDYVAKVLTYSVRPSTIQVYFTVMSVVWNYALRAGHVTLNPWLKPGLKKSPERDITWSKNDIERSIALAKEKGYPVLALYILLSYETAQRPWNDLRHLKWENVKQLEDGTFVIDFTISKTNTHIVIPLSNRASEALAAHTKVSPLIFVTENGDWLSVSGVKKQFEVIRKELGLSKKLEFRDLRRTAITELATAGCSTMEIEAITGWRCPDAVLRRYARVRFVTAQNAFEKRQKLRGGT